MAKQLNQSATVNMVFTADASQAKAQIASLQKDLSNLMTSALSDKGITSSITGATTEIAKLKTVLTNSTNELGRLDLTKFQKNLAASGTNIQQLGQSLNSLGANGQIAFSKLVTSITRAEMPLKSTNKLLNEMKTTLLNSARWTIASSAIKGVQTAISSAYNYAQDLNSSLTDIRIVSGKSADEMARFAQEANKAAKELNTTTRNYSDASLIYFQQGLNEDAVKQRTDITIKMANAAGESAEKVSSQLTAVWNNFDDGSKSLEYFADVMVKLGAYTASSTDEISAGLQKFAPIAKTVGLSYEYAASAIATITATTRESADTVGTSLKTIFSRIQGLSLGETLDDGTDLNKYSKALKVIGIDIKDASGNLKDMDDILDELGGKWDTLTRAEKMATAETVGGARQYTQLMNLMENWDYFQELVGVSKNSSGTLNEQAEIYAESWEAASKKVKASLEGLWNTLINEKFFIGLTNTFGDLIGLVNAFASSLNGLPGLLNLVSLSMVKAFGPSIATTIDDAIYKLYRTTPEGQQEDKKIKLDAAAQLVAQQNTNTTSGRMAANAYREQEIAQRELINNAEKLNSVQREVLATLQDQHAILVENAISAGDSLEQSERELTVLASRTKGDVVRTMRSQKNIVNPNSTSEYQAVSAQMEDMRFSAQFAGAINGIYNNLKGFNTDTPIAELQRFKSEALKILTELENSPEFKISARLQPEFDRIKSVLQSSTSGLNIGTGKIEITSLLNQLSQAYEEIGTTEAATEKLAIAFEKCGYSAKAASTMAEAFNSATGTLEQRTEAAARAMFELDAATRTIVEEANKAEIAVVTLGQVFSNLSSGLLGCGMGIQSLVGAFKTLKNPDISGFEKVLAISTSLVMTSSMVVSGFKALKEGITGIVTIDAGLAAVATATKALETATLDAAAAEELWALAKKGNNAATAEELVQKLTSLGVTEADKVATNMMAAAKWKEVAARNANIKAMLIEKVLKAGPYIVAFAAIAAGVAAVVEAVNYAEDVSDRYTTAINEQQKALQSLETEYDKIKSAYDEMASSYDSYEDAVDKLTELKEGTVEYRKALLEANKAASNLVSTNSDLYTGTNSNGLILINDKVYQQEQEKKLTELEEQQNRINFQKAQIQSAQTDKKEIDFLRENNDTYKSSQKTADKAAKVGTVVTSGVALGTLIGGAAALAAAFIPIAWPVIAALALGGAVIGGASAAKITSNQGKRSEDQEKSQLEDIARAYNATGQNKNIFIDQGSIKDNKEQLRAMLKSSNLFDDQKISSIINNGELVDSLYKNADETDALLTEISDTKTYLAQIARQNLTENDKQLINEQLGEEATNNYSVNAAQSEVGSYKGQLLTEMGKAGANGGNTTDIMTALQRTMAEIGYDTDSAEYKNAKKQFQDQYIGANAATTAKYYAERKYGDNYDLNFDSKTGKVTILDLEGNTLEETNKTAVRAAQIEEGYNNLFAPLLAAFGVKQSNKKLEEWRKNNKESGKMEELYNQASEDIQAQITLTDYGTVEELQNRIEELQAQANNDPIEIEVRLKKLSSALSDLKKDMSGSDWADFWANNDWGLSDIDKANFMASSYDQQTNFIQGQGLLTANSLKADYAEANAKVEKLGHRATALAQWANGETPSEYVDLFSSEEQAAYSDSQEKAAEAAEKVRAEYEEAALKSEEIRANMEAAIQEFDNYDLTDEEEDTADAMAAYAHDDFATMQENLAAQAHEQADSYKESDAALSEVYEDLAQSYEVSADLGLAAQQWARHTIALNNALERLESDYKTLLTDINKNKEGSELWCKAMNELQEVAEDIADTKFADKQTAQAFTKMAKEAGLFEQALNKDQKAIQKLSKSAKQANLISQIKSLGKEGPKAVQEFNKALAEGAVNLDQEYGNALRTMRQQVVDAFGEEDAAVEAFDRSIDNVLNGDYEMAAVDFSAFLTGWANAELAAGKSVEEIRNILNSVQGFTMQVNTKTETVPGNDSVTTYDVIHSTYPYDVDTVKYEYEGQVQKHVTQEEQKVTGVQVTAIPSDDVPMVNQDSGGGGGGGGGGQAKTPKAHKKPDMSKRYHRVKERLGDVDRQKEAASQAKERGYGKEKITQAETEIKLQKQKIELQKEYVEEAAKYLAEDRKTLEDFAASMEDITGMKLEFDDSGVITNFREIEKALLDYENYLIDLENGGMEGPWLELEQRRVDDMREYMDRYEETLNLYEEQLQEMFNQADELDQLYLELTDIKVVLKVDVAEDKLSFMEYLLGKIEDNAYKVADAMGYLGQETSAAMDKIIAYRQGIDEIMRRRMDINDDGKLMDAFYNGTITAADLVGLGFTQDDIDKIREYRDGLIEAMETLNEMRTNALDKLVDSFDSFNDQLEGQTATLEHHVSVLEAYKDIVDLIGTHNILQGRQILAQLNSAQLGAVRAQLGESKNVYDTLLAQRDEYKRAMEDAVIAGNEEAARLWQQRLIDINDTVNSAKETYLSNFQDALDTAIDIFSDSVELAAEDFDKLLSPIYNTIDALQNAYDRQEAVDNDYVQGYEKYYALQKNLRTLDEAIDDTDSIAAKNRLLKIQQEINNYKAEDVKLSQYDLDALEKRIELEKARIALEEGEDAKSTVALTRDSEGNWGYVYTADEEDIRQKEQEYEDKLKEYQDLNKDYINDLQKQILDFEAETRDAIKDVWQDTTLSESEKLTQIQQIYETAQQHMADLNQQMNNALANQAGTYELAIDRYKTSNLELIDSFEETRLSMLTGLKSTDEVMNSFNTALESYIVQLRKLQKDYEQNVEDIKNEADIQDWAKTITDEINKIGIESEETSANINKLSKDMDEAFKSGVKAAEDFEKQYGEMIDHMVSENERFIASLTNMIALLSKLNTANPEFKDLQSEYNEQTSKLRDGEISEADWDAWYKDWSKRMDKWLETFDTTGSYTKTDDIALKDQNGSVTPEVATLSAEDRAMLNSVVTNGTVMMAQGVGALDAAATITQGNETVVQQTVSITAEFPNVSDSNEITEALNNIINDASQYANRKDENF